MATVPVSLSPSSSAAFSKCPQQFKFSYIDRLPSEPSVASSRGTLVHSALEHLMKRNPAERTRDHAQSDLDHAKIEFVTTPDFTKLKLEQEDEEKFFSDAALLVGRYFDLEDPTTVNPIGLELKLEAEIGGVLMRGIIDRLDLDNDGELTVTDYKSGRSPSPRFQGDALTQVHTYAVLCQGMLGRRPKKVQLLYLTDAKAIVAKADDQTCRGIETKTSARWTAIKKACATDNFPTNTSKLCDWCSYKDYCPAFGGDPARAEELRVSTG